VNVSKGTGKTTLPKKGKGGLCAGGEKNGGIGNFAKTDWGKQKGPKKSKAPQNSWGGGKQKNVKGGGDRRKFAKAKTGRSIQDGRKILMDKKDYTVIKNR